MKFAERLGEELSKGQRVIVLGSIKTRSSEKDGKKQYRTEIHAREAVPLSARHQDAAGAKAEPAKPNGPLVLKARTGPIGDENEEVAF